MICYFIKTRTCLETELEAKFHKAGFTVQTPGNVMSLLTEFTKLSYDS